LETRPTPVSGEQPPGESSVRLNIGNAYRKQDAAQVLVEHLFAGSDALIPGVAYAVSYELAEEFIGGDIIDVYHFDNNAVAFSIADISGKGARAAVDAALIKYGLRALASHGLTPERVLRSLDRLYLENNTFEHNEAFATVFFAMIDSRRKIMTFASGGHEPAIIIQPDGAVEVLAPTAPVIGVFDDQHHLFQEDVVHIGPGTLFVATTDGVTESRTPNGELFGMERLIDVVKAHRDDELNAIVQAITKAAHDFSAGRIRDDMAILAVRFT
jgi:sigma-B regulation protein RsbU (phosphoserine phosphatase)